ncbi:MAG: hypothetical protein JNL38_18760 [Myxococcales bacterium]|jgi:hypothetical protein|nr:hypothetical protein [Myxococcales bacterium]
MTLEPEEDTPVDIAEWAADFRGYREDAKPSVEPVLARAAKEARREVLDWLGHTGGTLFAAVVFAVLTVRTKSPLMAGLSAIVLPTLIGIYIYFVYTHVALWRRVAVSVGEHAAFALRRSIARQKVLRVSFAGLILLTGAFWIWLPFWFHAHAEKFAHEPWRALVGVVAALPTFGLAFAYYAWAFRRARVEIESWRAVQASVAPAEGDRAP